MPIHDAPRKTLEQVVEEFDRYPLEAFEFVRAGLSHTVTSVHGDARAKGEEMTHVSGQQLSWGLRNFAVERYGLLGQTVLAHWGIHRTMDFGRIVFAMIDSKLMQKTAQDDIRDFEDVYSFELAFRPPQRPAAAAKAIFSV